jgi:hypothetical protein
MTTVIYTPAQTPILRDVVNRILNECGIQSQADLTTSNFLGTVTAINAVSDAVNDIKLRDRWEWLKYTAVVTPVAGQTSYPLPADFVRMAHPMTPWNGTMMGRSLQEQTADEYWQMIPSIQSATPGTPYMYMADSQTLTIYPAPDANFISQWPQLQFVYFKGPQRPLGAADQLLAVDIPPEFLECLVAFGKWKMKLFLEYPDWQAEQARYEQSLRVQMNRNNASRRAPRLRMTYPSNSVW